MKPVVIGGGDSAVRGDGGHGHRNSLLAEGCSISVADYRAACEDSISLRQAQRDLASHAQASGFTRGRRYRGKR